METLILVCLDFYLDIWLFWLWSVGGADVVWVPSGRRLRGVSLWWGGLCGGFIDNLVSGYLILSLFDWCWVGL